MGGSLTAVPVIAIPDPADDGASLSRRRTRCLPDAGINGRARPSSRTGNSACCPMLDRPCALECARAHHRLRRRPRIAWLMISPARLKYASRSPGAASSVIASSVGRCCACCGGGCCCCCCRREVIRRWCLRIHPLPPGRWSADDNGRAAGLVPHVDCNARAGLGALRHSLCIELTGAYRASRRDRCVGGCLFRPG